MAARDGCRLVRTSCDVIISFWGAQREQSCMYYLFSKFHRRSVNALAVQKGAELDDAKIC